MPIHGYPGNVITANPTAPTVSSASGVWTTEQQLINQSAGNWPMAATQVSLSTRFNSADSAYLSRTPTTASNRDTWTLSFWIKRTNLGEQYIFSVADGSASGFEMRFTSGDALRVNDYNPGVTDYIFLITSQLFRDVGAWYHIVLAVDTTQATNTNRVKIYVNGSQVTAFSSTTYPNQNQDTAVNTAKQHRFGAAPSSTPPTTFGNFYLAEVNFIDGLALTPAYFGFNNSDTGVWSPKQYTGAYGTNGFFLPFNVETVSFSADYLVVAGGGPGGGDQGGGGGSGGLSYYSQSTLTTGSAYTVTVGSGGTGTTGRASNGNNSVFSSTTSNGGGAGGSQSPNGTGNAGGSGGGGGTSTGGAANQGNTGGATGYGNAGAAYSASPNLTGGGGGAGAAGAVGSGSTAGAGGNGLAYSISGSSVTYAGGGGGGSYSPQGRFAGPGGTGGGGAGSDTLTGTGTAGTANLGGGGGGGGGGSGVGGNGGSGVVIIKIPDSRTANFSSGVTSSLSTAVSGYKIYTVTATSTTSETVTFS